jgi:parallel beta-helix repeat protein
MKLLWLLLPAILLGILLAGSAKAVQCTSCSDCNTKIAGAASGDTVELTGALSYTGTSECIWFNAKSGITLDCKGYIIAGDDTGTDNGIRLDNSNGNTIRNCVIKDFNWGVYLVSSSSNTLLNIVSNSNFVGIVISSSSNSNSLVNVTANSNTRGIDISSGSSYNAVINSAANFNTGAGNNGVGLGTGYTCTHNSFTNLTAKQNGYGVVFYATSEQNLLNNSIIEGNTYYGIYMQAYSSNYPRYQTLYNNVFNNTNNFGSNDINNQPNYFSTAKTAGTNIVGGPWIAGNVWANPSGTGFSQTCTDSNPQDGICDSPNPLSTGNVDNLPLKAGSNVYTCTSCSECSSKIAAASSGDTVQLTASISNQAGMCISFSGKSGITFDCLGNTIDGDDISYGYGIWMRGYNDEGSSYNTIRNCRITDFGMGVYIDGYTSTNNIISGCTADSNIYDGFAIASSSNNVLTNLTATSNGVLGVALMGSNNVLANSNLNSNSQFGLHITDASYNAITNITASGNMIGIKFLCQFGLQYTTINNSRIENNSQYGVYFQSVTGYNPRYNLFYNNYFNNTANLASDSVDNQPNYFSTAKTAGTNIISGPYIGGNFWGSPSGGFYPQPCTDATPQDGICDFPYTLSTGNVDNLPLKFFQQDTTPPEPSPQARPRQAFP